MATVKSPTKAPTPKVIGGSAGALVGGIVAAAINEWVRTASLPHPWGPIIDLLVPALLALAFGYVAPATPAVPANGAGGSGKGTGGGTTPEPAAGPGPAG